MSSGVSGGYGGGGTPPKKRFTVRKGVNSPSGKKVNMIFVTQIETYIHSWDVSFSTY